MKDNLSTSNNQIKSPDNKTSQNYYTNKEKKFEMKQTSPMNRNKIFSYTHSNFKNKYKKNKGLNLNLQNINNGLNVNIILCVTKREHKKITKEEEEQKIPKTSPYNFKYFCNTANKKGFSRALSMNNSIKSKNPEMESNFIKLSKEANIYTANAQYITNKKLLLFNKYNYENNKYKPNRANLFDMTSIPHIKNKNNTVYKTTKFRGGRMFFFDNSKRTTPKGKEDENQSNSKNIINISKKPLYLQELEKFELKTQNDFYIKNSIKKYVDNSFQTRKRHPPSNSLYKELVSKKNEIYDNFVNNKINDNNDNLYYPLFKSLSSSSPSSEKAKEEDKKNNNSNLNGYSNLLYKKKNDGIIPITFPLICSNAVDCDTISQRKRFENIMETFTKLKFLIENDKKLGKNNEIDYIIEFILNKKIDKKYLNNQCINNFCDFLKCKHLPIDTNKSLKENIIMALNYNKNNKNIIVNENIHGTVNENTKKNFIKSRNNIDLKFQKNSYNKPLEFDLERQSKLSANEMYKNKNDIELRDALKKELDFVVNDVENKQTNIKLIEENLNLLPFEENYYYKQKMKKKPKLLKNRNKEFLLISQQGYYKAIVPSNSMQKSKKKKSNKTSDNLFDSNERLYYAWFKNKNRDEINNYIKKSKLTEYIIYNRTKDKIIKNKLKEIAEKGRINNSNKQ